MDNLGYPYPIREGIIGSGGNGGSGCHVSIGPGAGIGADALVNSVGVLERGTKAIRRVSDVVRFMVDWKEWDELKRDCVIVRQLLVLLLLGLRRMESEAEGLMDAGWGVGGLRRVDVEGRMDAGWGVVGARRTEIEGRTDAGCGAVRVRVRLGRVGRRTGEGFFTGEGVSGRLPKPRA